MWLLRIQTAKEKKMNQTRILKVKDPDYNEYRYYPQKQVRILWMKFWVNIYLFVDWKRSLEGAQVTIDNYLYRENYKYEVEVIKYP